MAHCEILETCIFFNDRMKAMPATSEWMKTRFCRDRFAECARYRVCKALGRPSVPLDLLPTQTVRADVLLAGSVPPVEPADAPVSFPPPVKPIPPR